MAVVHSASDVECCGLSTVTLGEKAAGFLLSNHRQSRNFGEFPVV